jgi:hypothetical protein
MRKDWGALVVIYCILFLLGLGVSVTTIILQPVPGYMDAEYYYAGAIRLHEGYGWTQPFLWNYLDNPEGLPHPSHTYWMPLASLIGAVGMRLTGSSDYYSARVLFILLAALLPPLTAWLSFKLTGKKRNAILAGFLALFPGYYLTFTTVTENFTLYMLLGAVFLVVACVLPDARFGLVRSFLLGILAGFMHLTRADGLLWLAVAVGIAFFYVWRKQRMPGKVWLTAAKWMGVVVIGYSLVMSPWFLRNLHSTGSLFPPGGSKTLWLTDYNQTYHYPASELDMAHWLSAGWMHNLESRLHALGMNLKNTLAVQAEVLLLPLILVGLWRLRGLAVVRLAVLMWLVTLGVMTVVFPYAGWRGGFIHSGAALQPLWWAVAPIGLDAFLDWGVRRRNWDETSARKVFSVGLIGLSFLLTAALFFQRVIGDDLQNPAWRAGYDRYVAIEQALPGLGVQPADVVMVNNPPGLFVASRRSSVVVPDGTEETVVEVGRRYGAAYLLLDENYTDGLKDLYQLPGNRPGLTYLDTVAGTHVFRIGDR